MRLSIGGAVRAAILLIAVGALWGVAGIAEAAQGDLDPAFSRDGIVPVEDGSAFAVAALPDGGTLVGIAHEAGNGNAKGYDALKLTSGGDVDTSYGSAGTADASSTGTAVAMVVGADGKTSFLEQTSFTNTSDQVRIVRLNADGSPDAGFGAGGIVELDLAGASDRAYDAALAPDGRLLVLANGPGDTDVVAAVGANGTLDPGFGSGGVATSAGQQGPGRIAVGPSGIVVAAGTTIARLDAITGSPDPGFTGGPLPEAIGAGGVTGLVMQSGGATFVAGQSDSGDVYDYPDPFALRYDAAGVRDSGFADTGLRSSADGTSAIANDAAAASDGRLLLAGLNYRQLGHAFTDHEEASVFRLLPDGSRDGTFGTDGRASIPRAVGFGGRISYGDAGFSSLATDADGRIIAAGGDTVVRFLTTDGPPDADADGVLDAQDRCRRAYSTKHAGCPVFKRKLKMRLSHKRFSGRLRGIDFCVESPGNDFEASVGVPVFVFASRTGVDPVVGKARPDEKGRWTLKRRPKPGSFYYARVRRIHDPDVGICKPAESRTLHLRR